MLIDCPTEKRNNSKGENCHYLDYVDRNESPDQRNLAKNLDLVQKSPLEIHNNHTRYYTVDLREINYQ